MLREGMLNNFYMLKEANAKVIRGIREIARGGKLSSGQRRALAKKGYAASMSPQEALSKLDEISNVNSAWFKANLKRNRSLHPGNRFNPRSASAGSKLDLKINEMRSQPSGTYNYDQKEYIMNLLKRRRKKATDWNYDLKDTDVNAPRRSLMKIDGKKIFID